MLYFKSWLVKWLESYLGPYWTKWVIKLLLGFFLMGIMFIPDNWVAYHRPRPRTPPPMPMIIDPSRLAARGRQPEPEDEPDSQLECESESDELVEDEADEVDELLAEATEVPSIEDMS